MQILRRKRRTHLFCLHRVSVDRSAAPQASLLLCYLMRLRSCGDAERDILALLIYNAMDDNLTSVLSKVTIDELFSVGLISTVVQCLDGGDRNDILRWCACGIIERIVNRNDVDDKYMNELNRWNLSTKIVSSMDTESRRQYECARSIISTIICKDNVSFRSFRLDVLVQLMNAFTRSLKTETADLINDVIRAMIDRSELISGWSEAILPQIYTLIIVPKQTDQTLESILRILLTITDGFGFRDRIDKMVNYGFIPFLIRLISWQLITVQLPALNLIKNISQSYDEHLYDLLNGNLLVPLKEILRPSEPKTVRHATLEILLNISGGHRTDVIAIISAGFLPIVLDIMLNGDNTSQLLSACIVNNFTNRGGVEEIKFMIDSGALDALCKILSIRNNNIIIVRRIFELIACSLSQHTLIYN